MVLSKNTPWWKQQWEDVGRGYIISRKEDVGIKKHKEKKHGPGHAARGTRPTSTGARLGDTRKETLFQKSCRLYCMQVKG